MCRMCSPYQNETWVLEQLVNCAKAPADFVGIYPELTTKQREKRESSELWHSQRLLAALARNGLLHRKSDRTYELTPAGKERIRAPYKCKECGQEGDAPGWFDEVDPPTGTTCCVCARKRGIAWIDRTMSIGPWKSGKLPQASSPLSATN